MITGKKLNGLFISFLVGGAVGSAIALLYAPKKGKLLRNDISRKTNDLIDQGKKLTYDSWNGAKEAAESTFESANEFLNTGVEKIIDKTEKIKDAFRTGIDTYKDERRSGKNKGSLYNEVAEKK
jgi:gas vesicle protein